MRSWIAALAGLGMLMSCSKKAEPVAQARPQPTNLASLSEDSQLRRAPGLPDRDFVAPLADSYTRIDPSKDGWNTEAFTEEANVILAKLAKGIACGDDSELAEIVTPDFASAEWRPAKVEAVYQNGAWEVRRAKELDASIPKNPVSGHQRLIGAIAAFRQAMPTKAIEPKFKIYRIDPLENGQVNTRVILQGKTSWPEGTQEVNATWEVGWMGVEGARKVNSVAVLEYEESVYRGAHKTLFVDATASLLGANASYREQLCYPTDYWRARLPMDLGLDVVGNHGLSLGDVNGDLLDDLYICQQGGLPNRLYLQQPDGALKDISESSGTNWMDYCASALFVDFDNDGDKDLVVGQEWRILFMSNDGQGKFTLEFGLGSHAQTFSLAAADYDKDGDVDLFACGYNPSASTVRQGRMGEPMPFHDAKNGGRNMLLRNQGGWEFAEVTDEVGLGENNNRFSFAAAWEDYDNDGDLDLYVANDYGRNNLYRQDNGRFHDVAAELGVEDMASGMSVAWGDYNRDGRMDLYVSNMFSTAGNRITYQRQFKTAEANATKEQFQRFARGNSLFENTGGPFKDVSETTGVTLGRWAWASKFLDFNNDGWEDLVVANGFITAPDPGDL